MSNELQLLTQDTQVSSILQETEGPVLTNSLSSTISANRPSSHIIHQEKQSIVSSSSSSDQSHYPEIPNLKNDVLYTDSKKKKGIISTILQQNKQLVDIVTNSRNRPHLEIKHYKQQNKHGYSNVLYTPTDYKKNHLLYDQSELGQEFFLPLSDKHIPIPSYDTPLHHLNNELTDQSGYYLSSLIEGSQHHFTDSNSQCIDSENLLYTNNPLLIHLPHKTHTSQLNGTTPLRDGIGFEDVLPQQSDFSLSDYNHYTLPYLSHKHDIYLETHDINENIPFSSSTALEETADRVESNQDIESNPLDGHDNCMTTVPYNHTGSTTLKTSSTATLYTHTNMLTQQDSLSCTYLNKDVPYSTPRHHLPQNSHLMTSLYNTSSSDNVISDDVVPLNCRDLLKSVNHDQLNTYDPSPNNKNDSTTRTMNETSDLFSSIKHSEHLISQKQADNNVHINRQLYFHDPTLPYTHLRGARTIEQLSSACDHPLHSPLSVFVGNIPNNVTPEAFYKVMQLKGIVTEVSCEFRPSCWLTAFVTYSKPSEAAKAVECLHNRRAFKSASQHRLVCCFAPCPPPSLSATSCGISQHHSGIQAKSPRLSHRKLTTHSNSKVSVSPFFPKFCLDTESASTARRSQPVKRFSLLRDGPPGANLFIYGIPSDWTEVTLMRLCQEFGHIVGIRVPGAPTSGTQRLNKGFGFVSYDSTESSSRALKELTGRQFLGKPLIIQLKLGEQLSGYVTSTTHPNDKLLGHSIDSGRPSGLYGSNVQIGSDNGTNPKQKLNYCDHTMTRHYCHINSHSPSQSKKYVAQEPVPMPKVHAVKSRDESLERNTQERNKLYQKQTTKNHTKPLHTFIQVPIGNSGSPSSTTSTSASMNSLNSTPMGRQKKIMNTSYGNNMNYSTNDFSKKLSVPGEKIRERPPPPPPTILIEPPISVSSSSATTDIPESVQNMISWDTQYSLQESFKNASSVDDNQHRSIMSPLKEQCVLKDKINNSNTTKLPNQPGPGHSKIKQFNSSKNRSLLINMGQSNIRGMYEKENSTTETALNSSPTFETFFKSFTSPNNGPQCPLSMVSSGSSSLQFRSNTAGLPLDANNTELCNYLTPEFIPKQSQNGSTNDARKSSVPTDKKHLHTKPDVSANLSRSSLLTRSSSSDINSFTRCLSSIDTQQYEKSLENQQLQLSMKQWELQHNDDYKTLLDYWSDTPYLHLENNQRNDYRKDMYCANDSSLGAPLGDPIKNITETSQCNNLLNDLNSMEASLFCNPIEHHLNVFCDKQY